MSNPNKDATYHNFLSDELGKLNTAQQKWFAAHVALLFIPIVVTAAFAFLPLGDAFPPLGERAPIQLGDWIQPLAFLAFAALSMYAIAKPKRRYMAYKEAYLALRSAVGMCQMHEINAAELMEQWSRIDQRLHKRMSI